MRVPFPIKYIHAAVVLLAILVTIPLYTEARDTTLTRYTLPNGLDVLVKQDPARKVVTIQMWVLVGSADEEAEQRGISHLIEHMAFKGTERRGVGRIASEIEALGGHTNAYTGWDRTVFFVTVPSDKVLQGLDIITDAVLNPVIDPVELEKEKQVVLEEILESEERPARKASKLLFDTAYEKSPYKYPVIGYNETVEKFTRDDIMAFRKRWYAPQNMFMIVVGDVDPDKIRPEIEKMTRDFQAARFVPARREIEPPQTETRSALIREDNARETRLLMGFHVPSARGADVNALDLAADILGSRESSRLIEVLKKEKQLVNSIHASSITPREPGLFAISATLDAQNLEPAVNAIMEELQKLAAKPPSARELERAKINIESSYLYDKQTVGGMARNIGAFEADMGDAEFEGRYLKINSAVTAPEISQAVKKYLTAENATVAVLMPKEDAPNFQISQLTDIVQSHASSQSKAAERDSESEVLTRRLANGLRVVLIPDRSTPVVSFRLASLGGKRFETKDTQGIMNFTAKMLNKGTDTMTEDEIARKVEDMGGRINTFSGYDSFGVDATFFSRNLEDGLKLLLELYSAPSFPQDKMERERRLIVNSIKTEPDRPIQFALRHLNETLFTSHPYGYALQGTLDTVEKFTGDDLMENHRRFAVPSNTVITGVGDMDADKALDAIAKLFGTIPEKPVEAPDVPAEAALMEMRENIVRLPRAKAHLAVGFQSTTLDDEDRYALEVLSTVLSGMGGRLFVELRDKESLAYTLTSFVRPGKDPGMFAFYIATDPAKEDQALKGLFREIERVREEPVGNEELERAINNVIGRRQIALQSPWARAENIALNDLYGLGHDYDPEFNKRISQVTADQVLNAARKYLDPDRAAVVKIVPEEK
ncbi:MAG: pitrilysin family protein [Desulfomonilaceae bacterium]|nr:pitrilysin family protein [Desulfomonilaceae bacterium]